MNTQPAGDYSIGSEKWPGLSKLIEECGEVLQIAGKLIGTNGEAAHWDGSDLVFRIQEEVADLCAAIMFFRGVNKLDSLPDRIREKVDTFQRWHREQKAVTK